MDCCGLCADEDREVWLADQISPKIGLSDDDLLDYQSDDGLPMPPAAQRHRQTPASVPRRSNSSLRKPAPSPSHTYHQDYQHQSSLRPSPSSVARPPYHSTSANHYSSDYIRRDSSRRRGGAPQQDNYGEDSFSPSPPVIEKKPSIHPSSSRAYGESPGATGIVKQPTITRAKSSLMKRQSTGMMKQQQDHTPSDKEEDTAKAKSSEKSAGGGGGPTGGGVNGKVPTKLSELTPEEKEEEKKRLQALVKDFAKEAVGGFPVTLVDENSGRETSATFLMDRFLTTITLQREGDDHSPSLALEDITGIFKGDEAASHAPVAAETQPDHTRLLVLCLSVEPTTSVIIASSRHQRDKVYTCLKILSAAEGILMRQQRQHSMVLHERSAQLHSVEDLLEEKEERLAQQQMELEAQRQLLLEKDKEIEELQQKQKQLEEKAQAAISSSAQAPAFRPKIGGGPGGKAAGPPLKPGGGGGGGIYRERIRI